MSTEEFVIKEAITHVLGWSKKGVSVPVLVDLVVRQLETKGHYIDQANDVVRRTIIDGCNVEKWLLYDATKGGVLMATAPPDEKYYNVWCNSAHRWTNHRQDPNVPQRLTWDQAKEWFDQIGIRTDEFEIREILSDGTYGALQKTKPSTGSSAVKKAGSKSNSEKDEDLMRFFSAVAPGNCPCNCLKSACPTHKDL